MTCAVRRGGALSSEQKVRQRAPGLAFKSSSQARENNAGRVHHNTSSEAPYLATSRGGKPSSCHEGYRGSYKPDCTQEFVLDVRVQTCRRVEKFHATARLIGSLRQREHRECPAERSIIGE